MFAAGRIRPVAETSPLRRFNDSLCGESAIFSLVIQTKRALVSADEARLVYDGRGGSSSMPGRSFSEGWSIARC
jgi:hypothetical protein